MEQATWAQRKVRNFPKPMTREWQLSIPYPRVLLKNKFRPGPILALGEYAISPYSPGLQRSGFHRKQNSLQIFHMKIHGYRAPFRGVSRVKESDKVWYGFQRLAIARNP